MTGDQFTDAWRVHHAYLVDLAYRMLLDIGVAEDVVQEAYTRLSLAEGVEDERGWLTVVTSRLCLDHIRSARFRRERADQDAVRDAGAPLIGPPPEDPADRITLDDEVGLALFVVLRRLGPAERVAFVLHDVFGVPFESIAETLGRPATTCRQLARRARVKIAANPPGPGAAPATERNREDRVITEKFITACANGDLDGLLDVLHPDAWGKAEFGDRLALPPQVNHGARRVATTLLNWWNGEAATLVSYPVCGQPAVLAFTGRELSALITLTVTDRVITTIHVNADPATLRAL